jgi:hypothetical protein
MWTAPRPHINAIRAGERSYAPPRYATRFVEHHFGSRSTHPVSSNGSPLKRMITPRTMHVISTSQWRARPIPHHPPIITVTLPANEGRAFPENTSPPSPNSHALLNSTAPRPAQRVVPVRKDSRAGRGLRFQVSSNRSTSRAIPTHVRNSHRSNTRPNSRRAPVDLQGFVERHPPLLAPPGPRLRVLA